MGEAHRPLAVSRQTEDPHSPLNFTRRFLAARRASAALRLGEIAFVDAPAPILAFLRTHERERVQCLFNLSGGEVEFRGEPPRNGAPLGIDCGSVDVREGRVTLGPYAAAFSRA